ncbi:MAG: hypothetical protein Q8L74_15105 [Nitrospirota bacterium]|nr:hypothetical protein [Nitrospirota bacterium]MDP2381790.1 hypothetical protein [Nitrospirota bacterium]MDP3598545.1 hypothetical protein [Nitrospirota bacterium]
MSESGLRNQILGTVIGGVILTALGWIMGIFPTIWGWIVLAVSIFWFLVKTEIPIPIGLLFLLSASILWQAYKFLQPSEKSRAALGVPTAVLNAPIQSRPLSSLEDKVLRAFARSDGRTFQMDSLVHMVGEKNLLVDQALDSLQSRSYIGVTHNYIHGTYYSLTAKGRDVVIRLGYVS